MSLSLECHLERSAAESKDPFLPGYQENGFLHSLRSVEMTQELNDIAPWYPSRHALSVACPGFRLCVLGTPTSAGRSEFQSSALADTVILHYALCIMHFAF